MNVNNERILQVKDRIIYQGREGIIDFILGGTYHITLGSGDSFGDCQWAEREELKWRK